MPLRVGSGQARTSLQWKGTWKPANSGHGLGQSPAQRGKKLLPSLGHLPPTASKWAAVAPHPIPPSCPARRPASRAAANFPPARRVIVIAPRHQFWRASRVVLLPAGAQNPSVQTQATPRRTGLAPSNLARIQPQAPKLDAPGRSSAPRTSGERHGIRHLRISLLCPLTALEVSAPRGHLVVWPRHRRPTKRHLEVRSCCRRLWRLMPVRG